MNKIYIASSLKNYLKVIYYQDLLSKHNILPTYDWANNYRQLLESHSKESEFDLKKIAEIEIQAVKDCDLLFLVLPAGRGANFELGLAYGLNKPIILLKDEKELIAFYYSDNIISFSDESEALNKVVELMRK